MVKTCCVRNCDARAKEVTFFKFPSSRLLKRQWIDAIGLSSKLSANSSVCERHFRAADCELVRGRTRLRPRAVPALAGDAGDEDKEYSTETKDSEDENAAEKTEESTAVSNAPEKKAEEIKNKDKTNKGKRKDTSEKKKVKAAKEKIEDVAVKDKTSTRNSKECGEAKDTKDGERKEQRDGGDMVLRNGDGLPDVKTNGVARPPQNEMDELHEDIEEIITNYQIKQTRPLHNTDSGADENRLGDENRTGGENGTGGEIGMSGENSAAEKRINEEDKEIIEIQDDGQSPVFIELSLPERDPERAGSPRDCLMVLESVQVDVDPSCLLAGAPDGPGPLLLLDDEDDRREDPISLLTSSDEDEVIIQEPHIDTVEVSDETDDDDLPLGKLLRKYKTEYKKTKSKPAKGITSKQLAKFMWGMAEFYCVQCHFTTTSRAEFRSHAAGHSTILQVCQVCDYTSASKSQFARHKRKHKEDKRFKCHLCDYKARHNMSLIYHLKSHDCANLSSAKKGFKCDKCGFNSDVKSQVLKHVKLCSTNVKKYSCDKCSYESKRLTDLSRHLQRRHR